MFGRHEDLVPGLEKAFRDLIARVRSLAGSADPETLNRRLAPDSWSAAECIDHLNTSARLYGPVMAEAIEAARGRGLTGPRSDGRTLLGRLVVWSTEPPPRFKMTTQAELEPASQHDPAELTEAFASLHGALATQLADAADLDGKRVKVRSVLDSRLKLSLHDWFAFLAAHGRRHVWQAEQALERGRRDPGTGQPW